MKKLISLFLFIFVAIMPLFAQEDEDGGKDPDLFTRMPNHHIRSYSDKQFDSYNFWVGPDKKEAVEGRYISIIYTRNEGAQEVSSLQVIRNYSNAIKKIGGKEVYQYEDGGYLAVVLKLTKDGKEIWAEVVSGGNEDYTLNVVEKQAMEQDVIADASSMANSIKTAGKVAVYGIYFDTGKSELKPESQNALMEISKLLKADPSLKLYVVGHTDNVGTFDSNIKLSMDRASAVINALVTKHSVNAANLKPFGNGPCAPVATNETDEGKALNRRVELVKQ
jgi:outer membrane protein OmpA-like peptidoglycan-associated protein